MNILPELFKLVDRGENQSLLDSAYIDSQMKTIWQKTEGKKDKTRHTLKKIVKLMVQ